MKLRAGTPLWLSRHSRAPARAPKLRGSVECDVAIVGGGITGTLVAYELLQAGLRVVMIDKRRPGTGSTAASTGLLMYQPDVSVGELTRRHSRRVAERVFQLGRDAILELGALARRLRIQCDWRSKQTLYVASRRRHVRGLRTEAIHTHQLGFPGQVLSLDDLRRRFGLRFAGALLSPGAAEVHALALSQGVLRHCRKSERFELFEQTRVRSLRDSRAGVTVLTDQGEIRAKYAIVAAGYEAGQFVHSRLVSLRSTYVIASRPLPSAKLRALRCLVWDTARPYFYLRTTADRRIVFGGSDDLFVGAARRDKRLRLKTRELEAQFAALFPPLAFRADFAWTGTFAETSDGLPCIGPTRRNSRVLHALGYGGNGITFSQIAAKILRDLCLGKKPSDAALFAFDGRGRRRRPQSK